MTINCLLSIINYRVGDTMKYDGLTDEEVVKLQEKYGKNIIEHKEKEKIVSKIYTTIKKPLIILLIMLK